MYGSTNSGQANPSARGIKQLLLYFIEVDVGLGNKPDFAEQLSAQNH